MPEQSHFTGAVFLSYASQDAEAAERICEALRVAGVEVWLDKSELRGGDAWDAQIKKRIHDCALFIPVISAQTNVRTEGYFRREWKLATRRLLDISDDAAFLVPVVIDETREAEARVPEEFLHAQWTRLPGGATPPEFAQRLRQLLGTDISTAHTAQSATLANSEPSARVGYARNRTTPPVRLVVPTLIALLVLGAGTFWYFQRASDAPAAKSTTTTLSPVAAPHEKSIAVLPFADMSAGKDQEYFADGLSEELINLLAKIPDLRVVARTSAFKFKGEKVTAQDVARQLNVAHVLEGSVRKSGNKVRITVQLIKAEDGYHLWSETYDRVLDDIFVVQDDIAGAVVKALQVSLLNSGLATSSKTRDPEAYNLVLKARHFRSQDNWEEALERSINYYRQSLQRDPSYAVAWASLSHAYALQGENGIVPVAEGIRRARDAAEKALSLDPRLVDAHLAMGRIHITYDWDWAAADASYSKALELDPGSAITLQAATLPAVIFGRWDEALELANKAIVRDPLDSGPYMSLGVIFEAVNRDKEAEFEFRKAMELNPGSSTLHMRLGRSLLLRGEAEAALREVQQVKDENWRLTLLPLIFNALGRRSESDAEFATLKKKYSGEMAYQIAEVHAFRGEADLAFEWLERAYDQRDPGVVNIKSDRIFRKLVTDPRYKAFLKKMKLPV